VSPQAVWAAGEGIVDLVLDNAGTVNDVTWIRLILHRLKGVFILSCARAPCFACSHQEITKIPLCAQL